MKKMKTSKKTTFSRPIKKRNKAPMQRPGRHKGDGNVTAPNNADRALGSLRGY